MAKKQFIQLLAFSLILALSAASVHAERLPSIGSDSNNWGTILNNYLLVTHDQNGTLRTDLSTAFNYLNVTSNLLVAGNIYGEIPNSFKNANFTALFPVSYDARTDRYNTTNFTNDYNNRGDRYGNSNFTSNYDSRTDRFGNENFTASNVGAFNNANYTALENSAFRNGNFSAQLVLYPYPTNATIQIGTGQVTGLAGFVVANEANPTNATITIPSGQVTGLGAFALLNEIPDNNITSAKILDAAVTGPKIGANAVTTGKISPGTIKDSDINSNAAIALSKLFSGSNAQILVDNSSGNPNHVTLSGDATITNAGLLTIANDAVTTVKIIDGAVTNAKIASVSSGKVTGLGGFAFVSEIADGNLTIAKTNGLQTALDAKASLNSSGQVPASQLPSTSLFELIANKGTANGYASLNSSGKVPPSQLPSFGSLAALGTITASELTAGDFSSKINSGTYSIAISGNAATATALAANGANCAAGSYAAGVDASGAAEGCTALLSPTGDGSGLTGLTKTQVGLGSVTNDAQLKAADLDTDGNLAANSDSKIPSQKAVKTYADTKSLLAGSASLVTVGTITTGTWHGTAVEVAYGGTGATTSDQAKINLAITIPVGYYKSDAFINDAFFIADRAYKITSIKEAHRVAGSDAGTVNIEVEKLTGTTAPGSGTALLTDNANAGLDLKATANTVQTGTLTGTAADLQLSTGDRISIKYSGTTTSLAGVAVTVILQYI